MPQSIFLCSLMPGMQRYMGGVTFPHMYHMKFRKRDKQKSKNCSCRKGSTLCKVGHYVSSNKTV